MKSIITRRWNGIVLTLLFLAGCGGVPEAARQPSQTIQMGDERSRFDFSQPFQWEHYNDSMRGIQFGIADGEYRARIAGEGFAWALNAEAHTDVVIQVDTQQLSADEDNGYGLVCRAAPDNSGNGYYFLISGDGAYTLRRGITGSAEPIIAWARTSAVNRGAATNRIRIACIEDYLALWVNGVFIAEARDTRYQRGYTGLAAIVPRGQSVDVTFDDVIVWSAALPD